MQYTKINYTKEDILEVCNTSSISLTTEQLNEVYDWYTNGVPTTTYSSSIMILISIIEHVHEFGYHQRNTIENSTVALRYNEGKPQWSLVDFKSLEPMVRVLELGAQKYSRDNWKKGLDNKQICESIMRHLVEVLNGNFTDLESNQHHMGHIMANAMFYIYQYGNLEKNK